MLLSIVSAAPARCATALNHRRKILSADGVVATLFAPAHLNLMSPRNNKMAASERSMYSARSIPAWKALEVERAARQAARDFRGQ